jgi:hypothetical protein
MIKSVHDSSYYVAGFALQALININPDTAYKLADQVLRLDPKSALYTAAWSAIVSKGNPEDMVRFERAAKYVYGTEKVALANNLERYALAVKDETLYERALALLVSMAKSEAIRGYRFAIGANVFELRDAYKKTGKRAQLATQYGKQVMEAETDPENISKYKTFGQ